MKQAEAEALLVKYSWRVLENRWRYYVGRYNSEKVETISDEKYDEVITFLLTFTEADFLTYVLIGFIAQMIDGALGMAYGASSMTMLTSYGITSAIANSCIKLSEVFTTSASGFSHWKLGNINKKLVKNLNYMNNIFRAIIAGYGAKKLGGGCLGTIILFIIIYMVLGQC